MKRAIRYCTVILALSVALGAERKPASAPQLTDPLATPQTAALYGNLHKVAQKGILFAHQDTLAYLRKTKGLHHIITCYSPDRFKDRDAYLERYPGDDYIDILGHDNYGDLRSIATQDQAKRALETVAALAEERNKVAALTETGVSASSPANATWWTDVLLEVVKSSPSTKKLAWVLVWRNADSRQNFAPFPGSPGAENFKAFERNPFTLFLEDLPRMYE